jgi:hypothetical protein
MLNMNMLGDASGTTIEKLDVAGSAQPLYLNSVHWSSPDKIHCLGLATTPGTQDRKTAFGILDEGGKGQHNIVMSECLTPVKATLEDNGAEYSTEIYTPNPHYETVVKIFQVA